RRFHLPTRDDPTIAATVADAEVVEKRKLEAVTSELVALQQANVSGKVYSAFRDQLGTIEASLVAARAKVVEFDAFHKR
ncbi:hypothetical protein SPRG_14108, partial [Saprolegnia parasitica CBS 223.65]